MRDPVRSLRKGETDYDDSGVGCELRRGQHHPVRADSAHDLVGVSENHLCHHHRARDSPAPKPAAEYLPDLQKRARAPKAFDVEWWVLVHVKIWVDPMVDPLGHVPDQKWSSADGRWDELRKGCRGRGAGGSFRGLD